MTVNEPVNSGHPHSLKVTEGLLVWTRPSSSSPSPKLTKDDGFGPKGSSSLVKYMNSSKPEGTIDMKTVFCTVTVDPTVEA